MTIYQIGSTDEEVRLLQKALNEQLKLTLITDGVFGKITSTAVYDYQVKENAKGNTLVKPNGIYDLATQACIREYIDKRFIRNKDIVDKAHEACLDSALLLAFRDVEAKSDGFLPDGRPVILFERHKFYSYIKKIGGKDAAIKLFNERPDICNPVSGGYYGGLKEYIKYSLASAINKEAASLSCSWGLFQIMGFNYDAAGYKDVDSYVSAMMASEALQLKAVISFIKHDPELVAAMQAKKFTRIAEIYNGADQHGYDNRLQASYQKYKSLGY